MSAYIYIYETVKRYRHDSDADEWINIRGTASLDAGLRGFAVTGIEKYTSSKIIPKGRLEELEAGKKEIEKVTGEKPISQKMFKAI